MHEHFEKFLAIEILTSRRQIRRFKTYDLEWIPGTLVVRIVGCYDGSRYRSFTSVGDFLAAELTSTNRGTWYYAHAGGLADVQFVLDHLVQNPRYAGWNVRASFSGSSAIIVRVTYGKNSWIFVDSFWLLRDKLAKIAIMIGMEKGGPDEDWTEEETAAWYASVPFDELRSYNANDCVILYNAIRAFETALLSLGGQLQMTLASSSMQLFRRKYLTRAIETSSMLNDKLKEAYCASRVEVFVRMKEIENALYYDINSSFPFAMTYPCPGEVIGVDRGLPVFEGRIYFSDVTIEVPDCYLTPTPYRGGGRLFFPFGRWRAWLSSTDIELLIHEGGKILKVWQTYHFEPFHDLANFARDLYAKRKSTTDPVEDYTYKIVLNSTYGKFAESANKSMIHVHPTANALQRLTWDNLLFPGVYEETITVPVPHAWIPIAAHITAIARASLYEYLGMTRRFHYCDTDGFSTLDRFPTGPGLGELKLEREVKSALFVQPKLYRLDDKVKAKGFSLGWDDKKPKKKAHAIELFETLLAGGDISVRRMVRIKENLAKGLTKPREKMITKRVHADGFTKRFHGKDGVSRPWSIEELRKRGIK